MLFLFVKNVTLIYTMYKLPHPLNRPYQLETANRILQSPKKIVIINARTGSGKSAYVAYAAFNKLKTLACVRTKSLQGQYRDGYNFYSITGKSDYLCNGYGQNLKMLDGTELSSELTADLCALPKDKDIIEMCKYGCPYPLERDNFINSIAGVTNYSKFLNDRKLVEDFYPDILFLDEAHELGESIVTEFSGKVFRWDNKRLMNYCNPIKIDEPHPIALPKGKRWLEDLQEALDLSKPLHPSKGGDKRLWKWHKNLSEKIEIILEGIDIDPHCWFIRSDEKGLTVKPKTAAFHFLPLFNKCKKIVLMSATIQKRDIDALGITDYELINVPSIIPPLMRPVYDLKAPAYKRGMTWQEKKEHAQIISQVFKDRRGWNGIIHVTSKDMAYELANMLSVNNPMWIPEPGDTDKSYSEWQMFNRENKGAICISWQFFAGVDMGDVNISITARVPYPYFGDEYEKERFSYSPSQALTRIANTMEQQPGRIRRGFAEHYGPNADKFCGIADGKWYKIKPFMQKDFLESIF